MRHSAALSACLLAACAAADAPPDAGALDSAPADSAALDSADTGALEPSLPAALSFEGERPRSVLMISMDTLRRDHVGEGAGVTPTLDGLIEGGFLATRGRSCSNWTYDSVVCAQTGRTALAHGVAPYFTEDAAPALPDEALLASEHLRDLGFQGALISGNGMLGGSTGTGAGFDSVALEDARSAAAITALALDAAASFEPDRPWYLHAHYAEPHAPYSPPDEYRGELEALEPIPYDLDGESGLRQMDQDFDDLTPEEQALALAHLSARYRGEIRYMDAEIGALLDALDARGLLDDALIVLWSDHGEQFYEHGSRGHGASLHEGENRAVIAWWAPGLEAAEWTGPVSLLDVWPTTLSALDLPALPDAEGLPVGNRPDDDPLFAHKIRERAAQLSVVRGDDKLIYDWGQGTRLYDLGADPGEAAVLDAEDPRYAELWGLLEPAVWLAQSVCPELPPPGLRGE